MKARAVVGALQQLLAAVVVAVVALGKKVKNVAAQEREERLHG